MSSSLLPAAGEQDRATTVAPVRLERVKKREVRSAISEPTPNRRPQCSRHLATIMNGVNQKLLFFRTAFQHMIQVSVPNGLATAIYWEIWTRKFHASFIRFILWNQM